MRRSLLPAVLAATLALSGCGLLRTLGDPGVDGFGRQDESLRRLLMTGSSAAALKKIAPEAEAAPRDELLRLLFEGTVARYAGEYEASNRALERAAEIAEDRYTRSVSRAALSTLTSDLALAYRPGEAERLLVHYYGALNYLDRGELDGAAVEARRLSRLLTLYDDEGESRSGLAAAPALRHFAGAVFEAAGERADAEVSYRQAAALARDSALVPTGPLPDSVGVVVVLIERGFVAHRVEQSLNVLIGPHEMHVFGDGDSGDRTETAAAIAARITAQAFGGPVRFYDERPRPIFVDAPPAPARVERCEVETAPAATAPPGGGVRPHPTHPTPAPRLPVLRGDSTAARSSGCEDESDDNPYLLRLAWPVFLSRPTPPPAAELVLPDSAPAPLRLSADVSAAVADDFQEQRTLLLARTVARAAAKLALTKKVEREVAEENEGLGRVLGLVANAGTAILERADTRSWHLLPASIGLVRVRLPAGEHRLSVREGSARPLDLGPVTVRAGRVSVVSTRIWQ